MSAIRVFLMYCDYRQFRRDMKPRPLFGRSPLFGESDPGLLVLNIYN